MAPEAVEPEQVNEYLKAVSAELYGASARSVELRVVDPRSLVLLKKNARFFQKSRFDQLRDNIEADRMLASVPYCFEREDGSLLVASGNHRVKAAVAAKVPKVLVFVEAWSNDERELAVQVSHNALEGEDDKQILAELWGQFRTLAGKLYAGLDSKTVAELEKIQFQGFSGANIPMESMLLWFLPEEVARLDAAIEKVGPLLKSKRVYLAPLECYEKLWKALVTVKHVENVKNTAVAFMVLLAVFEGYAERLIAQAKEEEDAGGSPGDGSGEAGPAAGGAGLAQDAGDVAGSGEPSEEGPAQGVGAEQRARGRKDRRAGAGARGKRVRAG